jgi:glutamyl-Q tRNA(Asp) synthetase
VRIEDLDPPRERPGAADAILRALDRLGLHWDGPVVRQGERSDAYAAALARLSTRDLLQRCTCSRSTLLQLPANRHRNSAQQDELYHPPQCPSPPPGASVAPGEAWRLGVPAGQTVFVDRSLGMQSVDVLGTVGPFVLRRRDGLFAYQLAVVVDDAEQGITDVVRGCDLLTSTARQVLVQQALGLAPVRYLHLPLAVDHRGRKLSKSEDAPALDRATPARQLSAALEFLGQAPPAGLSRTVPAEVLTWGREHWRVEAFAGRTQDQAARGEDAGDSLGEGLDDDHRSEDNKNSTHANGGRHQRRGAKR